MTDILAIWVAFLMGACAGLIAAGWLSSEGSEK